MENERSVDRPAIHSPIRRVLAVTTLGAAALLQGHESRPALDRVHRAAAAESPAEKRTSFEELTKGSSLMNTPLTFSYDIDGSETTIHFMVHRTHNGDLRLKVLESTFRCDADLPIVGRVSQHIQDVTAHDDGIVLSSLDHGHAHISRSEMEYILRKLADTQSQEITLSVKADFTPAKNSAVEQALAAMQYAQSFFGKAKTRDTWNVPFAREPDLSGRIAAR